MLAAAILGPVDGDCCDDDPCGVSRPDGPCDPCVGCPCTPDPSEQTLSFLAETIDGPFNFNDLEWDSNACNMQGSDEDQTLTFSYSEEFGWHAEIGSLYYTDPPLACAATLKGQVLVEDGDPTSPYYVEIES